MDIKTNIRVLIVDDLETSRKTMRMILKSLNYTQIEEAGNGKQALQKLEEESRIGLILLDWNMPEMSGMEFYREFRKDPKSSHIKVIMVTAETLQANIVTAIQAGIDQYIVKPVMPKTLEEKIVNVMNKDFQEMKTRLVTDETLITRSSADEQEAKEKVKNLYHDAIEKFKTTTELFPWKAAPHYETALLYLKLGLLLEAKKKLEIAIEIEPLHEASCIEMSRLLIKRKQSDKAIKILSGLSAINPSSVLHQELGEAYLQSGKTNKAIKAFNDSIQYANNHKKVSKRQLAKKHEGLGNAFRQKHQETKDNSWQDKSIASLEKSLEYDAKYISAHFNLISAYKKSGQMEKAADLLKSAAEITPDDSNGWLSLGKVFLESNEAPKAGFAFKRAIELSNTKGQTYFEIGDIYEASDLETASKFLLRANLTMPGQSYILNKLGMVQRMRGNLEDSIKFYNKALQADQNDEKIAFNLAFAYLKSNIKDKKTEAKKHLENALKLVPDFKEAQELLSTLS